MKSAVILEVNEWDKFKHETLEVLRNEIEKVKSQSIEKPLTRDEAAQYWKVTVHTLDKWFKSGVLPGDLRHIIGGQPRFYASEFEVYLKKKRK